jgi:nitric oxide reductase subunit B
MKDVIQNGYWHARSIEFTGQEHIQLLAWLRLPADTIFIVVGVLPMLYAVSRTWLNIRRKKQGIKE